MGTGTRDDLLGPSDAADLLGRSVWALTRLRVAGRIEPAGMVGNAYTYRRADLLALKRELDEA